MEGDVAPSLYRQSVEDEQWPSLRWCWYHAKKRGLELEIGGASADLLTAVEDRLRPKGPNMSKKAMSFALNMLRNS